MEHRQLKRNAFLNMVRRGAAIVFPLITFSYASHVLGTDNVGIYSYSLTFVNYFLLIAALGVSTYAIREGQTYRDQKDQLTGFACEVYSINLVMTGIAYVLLAIVLFLWPKMAPYRSAVMILSISILLTTLGADWINVLMEDYLFITIRYIVVQVICLVSLLVFVRTPEDLSKYIVIGMFANAGGNLLNVFHVRKLIPIRFTRQLNLKKHIKPLLTLFSNSVAIRIYLLADITILGLLMSDHFVGVYYMASRIYTTLKELINALILVTIPRFSYYLSHDRLPQFKESCTETVSSVLTLIFPVITGLFFEADNIVYIMGGSGYLGGTPALQILACAMFFAVGGCFFSNSILLPFKKERWFLISTVTAALVNVGLNFVLIPKFGIDAAAITTLIAEIIVFVMVASVSLKTVSFSVRWRDLLSSVVGSAVIAAICILFANVFGDSRRVLEFLLSVGCSVAAYAAILIILKNSFALGMLRSFGHRLHKDENKS